MNTAGIREHCRQPAHNSEPPASVFLWIERAPPHRTASLREKKTAGSGGTAEGRQREAASAAGGHPRLRRPRLRHRCAASGPPPRALASPASLRPFPFSLLHHLVPRPLGRKGYKRGLCCRPAPHPQPPPPRHFHRYGFAVPNLRLRCPWFAWLEP